MENVIKVSVWRCWIMNRVMTISRSLKIDNCVDTMMSFDAIYHHRHLTVCWGNCHQFTLSLKYIIASPQLSILRQSDFVTTCFMIKSFNISTWFLFSNQQSHGLTIISWTAAFVKCKQFGVHCLSMFTRQFTHQFIHQKCSSSCVCSQRLSRDPDGHVPHACFCFAQYQRLENSLG